MTDRSLRVFLCHSFSDKVQVHALYKQLCTDGIDAWLDDEKILPGQKRSAEIKQAVEQSDVIIVCLSRDSVTREGLVQRVIKQALDIADEKPDNTIFIIPALLEYCDIPERLQQWQWVNLIEPTGYERLMKSLKVRENHITQGIEQPESSHTLPKYLPEPPKIVPLAKTTLPIPELVKVPAGTYRSGITSQQVELVMGSVFSGRYNIEDSDESKNDLRTILTIESEVKDVYVSEFYIGKYPITNQEFSSFIANTNYKTEAEIKGQDENWRKCFRSGMERYPVVCVSWNDAIAYCKWLSEKTAKDFRLPTLDEWMKVLRGPEGRLYPWGDIYDSDRCNSQDSMRGFETTEVGIFDNGKNYCGVYDLVGNVDEWTMSNERGYKIIMGSSWNMVCEIYGLPFFKRRSTPFTSTNDLGFRVVCN